MATPAQTIFKTALPHSAPPKENLVLTRPEFIEKCSKAGSGQNTDPDTNLLPRPEAK